MSWTVISVLLFFLVKYMVEAGDEVWDVITNTEVAWLFPLLTLLCIVNLVSAGLWALLIRSMEKHLSMRSLVAIWHQWLLVKYVPGSIWVHVGRIYHLRRYGIPIKTAGYVSIVEQLTVLGSSAFVVMLSPKLFSLLGVPGWIASLLIPIVLVSLAPKAIGELFWKLGIRRFDLRLAQSPKKSLMFGYFCGHVVRVLLGGCSIKLILLMLGYDTQELSIFDLAGIGAASFVVGYLSLLTPGGIGVKEGVLIFLLGQAVPLPVAVLVAVSGRIWPLLSDALGAGVGSLYIRWSKEGLPKDAVAEPRDAS